LKFRFVDKITSWQPWQTIAGTKAVSFEEYCLKESFGDGPRMPEMLLLESFLQLGNWLVMLSSDFTSTGMVARISEVRFDGFLLPGERIHLQAHLTRRHEDGVELRGEGHVGDRLVISGSGCLAGLAPLAEFQNPDDLRTLFSEIYEPSERSAP